ncbi:MAG: hypothetical protein WKF81_11585 [Thermomicrobiales bacterium]
MIGPISGAIPELITSPVGGGEFGSQAVLVEMLVFRLSPSPESLTRISMRLS